MFSYNEHGTGPNTDISLMGAQSYHPGGVNVTLLDGSVKFVKDSINPAIWRAIATREGGEVVSADQW